MTLSALGVALDLPERDLQSLLLDLMANGRVQPRNRTPTARATTRYQRTGPGRNHARTPPPARMADTLEAAAWPPTRSAAVPR
jgi:hypothetical protein